MHAEGENVYNLRIVGMLDVVGGYRTDCYPIDYLSLKRAAEQPTVVAIDVAAQYARDIAAAVVGGNEPSAERQQQCSKRLSDSPLN